MGRFNLAVNKYMEQPDIFADFINGTVFNGEQVLCGGQLTLLSPHKGELIRKKNRSQTAVERHNDIRMEADFGTYCLILGTETQESVNYTMPIRNLLYDALDYTEQIRQLKRIHREKKDLKEKKELLSGISVQDRLKAVITLVLYCDEEWDGQKSLYGMLGVDEEDRHTEILKKYLPDYRINLIQPCRIDDMRKFKTSLQHLFSLVKYKSDKKKFKAYLAEHREEINALDEGAQWAAGAMIGNQRFLERYSDEKGEFQVCRALDEMLNDEREEGMKEGIKEGIKEGEMGLVWNMVQTGMEPERIAQVTQKSVETIQRWVEHMAKKKAAAIISGVESG